MSGGLISLYAQNVTVPDTDTGSTGNDAVNSDRLMAEIAAQTGNFVERSS